MTKLDKFVSDFLRAVSLHTVQFMLLAKLFGEWGAAQMIYIGFFTGALIFYVAVALPLAYIRDLKAQRDEARDAAKWAYRRLIGAVATNLADVQMMSGAVHAMSASTARFGIANNGNFDVETTRILARMLRLLDPVRATLLDELIKLDPLPGTAARRIMENEQVIQRARVVSPVSSATLADVMDQLDTASHSSGLTPKHQPATVQPGSANGADAPKPRR